MPQKFPTTSLPRQHYPRPGAPARQQSRHPTFGIGRIAELSDIGRDTRAIIEFDRAGRKTLVLQYAHLVAVG